MRILVVEDEKKIAVSIGKALKEAGYLPDLVHDGEEAWFRAETEDYDGIVLDLGLPKLDGLTVLRRLRDAGTQSPILILSARSAWRERVAGIDAGADDYLAKPFYVEELVARLGAILRRSNGVATPLLCARDLTIDTRRMLVSRADKPITLTSLEYRMLRYLVTHKGRIVPQTELQDHVYASEAVPDSNALEVLMNRLRKKVGADMVMTRRGLGYIVEDAA
ncbi:MAG: response regulator transcription factor [Hyphomicrobiales bacterium]|nr:response regulator transcription factor [Hyphomicrobiales bacterium]